MRSLLGLLVIAIHLACVPASASAQQPDRFREGRLTIEDVVKLSQTGLSEDLILTKIKKNGKAFDLSTDELLELKKVGVSDNVIKFLLDPTQPYTPVSSAPAAGPVISAEKSTAPVKEYPADELASKVPLEPGLYYFRGAVPIKIDIKILLGAKQGAGLGKLMMKKGKVSAYLAGVASKTRISDSQRTFYMRLPEGKGMEEIALFVMDVKQDRRETDMGAAGPKQELRAAIKQFESLEVSPHLFRINTGTLSKGEYLFFLIGSPEPAKGSQGKGYDFGIDDLH